MTQQSCQQLSHSENNTTWCLQLQGRSKRWSTAECYKLLDEGWMNILVPQCTILTMWPAFPSESLIVRCRSHRTAWYHICITSSSHFADGQTANNSSLFRKTVILIEFTFIWLLVSCKTQMKSTDVKPSNNSSSLLRFQFNFWRTIPAIYAEHAITTTFKVAAFKITFSFNRRNTLWEHFHNEQSSENYLPGKIIRYRLVNILQFPRVTTKHVQGPPAPGRGLIRTLK